MEQIVKFLTGYTAKGRQNYDSKVETGEVDGGIYFDLYNRQIVVNGKNLNNNIEVKTVVDETTGAEIEVYEFEGKDGQKIQIRNAGITDDATVTDDEFSAIREFKGGILTPEQMAALNQMMSDLGYTVIEKEIDGTTYKGIEKSKSNVHYWECLDDDQIPV